MPTVGQVGKAPPDYFVSYQGDPNLPWYVYITDDREGSTGGFVIYWNQSPRFDTEPLFDDWAETEEDLGQWDLGAFEWLPQAGVPPGLAD